MNPVIIFSYAMLIIPTVGGIYGLINRNGIGKAYLWLSVFLLFSGIFQILAIYWGSIFKTNILFLNMLLPVYYILVYLIFSNLSKNKYPIKLVNIVFIVGSLPILIYSVFAISRSTFAIEAISISNMVYSIGCMILFLDLIKSPVHSSPFKLAKFYVLTAFLFYHSAILFFWISKSIVQGPSFVSLEYINNFMLFIYYTILFGALIVEKRYGLKDES